MKSLVRACIRCLVLLVAVTITASAIVIAPSLPTYDYVLTLPRLSMGEGGPAEVPDSWFQFEFTWIGPLEADSLTGSSDCSSIVCNPIGSPMDGVSFLNATFTIDPTLADPEVILIYVGDFTTIFTLIEPDSFWATTGVQPFDIPAGFPSAGNPGAYWAMGALDPPCNSCSVDTTAPEPGTFPLLATSLGGLIAMLRRRFAMR